MRYKFLGKSQLRVSELCLGTMTFDNDRGWGASKAESRKIYDAFRTAGGNFIETCAIGEKSLEEIVATDRQSIVLSTKYLQNLRNCDRKKVGNPHKNILQSLEISLKQLGTDYIDLLWLQGWNFDIPIEIVMRSLHELVLMGKVLSIGISDAPAWIISRCNLFADLHGWAPFIATQVEYNPSHRAAEQELLPMTRELCMTAIARLPIENGWLSSSNILNCYGSGKYRTEAGYIDSKTISKRAQTHNRILAIAEEISQIAREIGCSSRQVGLNWMRQQEIIPLLGISSVSQIEDCLECVNYTLSAKQMYRLHEISQIEFGILPDFFYHYPAKSLARDRADSSLYSI